MLCCTLEFAKPACPERRPQDRYLTDSRISSSADSAFVRQASDVLPSRVRVGVERVWHSKETIEDLGGTGKMRLHLSRIKSSPSQDGGTNRVTTPRWENDAGHVRSTMSKALTYQLSARDRETGAHDALVCTYRIIDPPDSPAAVMHHFPLDRSGVGRAYALYTRNQHQIPSWNSSMLH